MKHRLVMRRAVTLAFLLPAITGCSLFEPYHWNNWEPHDGAERDLDKAVARAIDLRNDYLDAADAQAGLSTIGGTAVIPFVAAAGGLALTGGATAPIAALSLAGASGAGAASWLRSATREDAYILGASAVTCVLEAVKPLQNVSSLQRQELQSIIGAGATALRANLGEAELAWQQADAALTEAKARYADVEKEAKKSHQIAPESNLDAVSSDLDGFKTTIDNAQAALQSGVDLEAKFGAAAANVVAALRVVQDAVNKIIKTTIPDLATLPAMLNGITSSVKLPTTPAAAGAKKDAGAPAAAGQALAGQAAPMAGVLALPPAYQAALDGYNQAVAALDRALETLRAVIAKDGIANGPNRIAALVDVVNSAVKQNTVSSGCPIDFSQVKTGITIAPTAVTLDLSADASITVAITGGKPPYFKTEQGAPPPDAAIKVESPSVSGSLFVLKITTTKTGLAALQGEGDKKFVWIVSDSAGNPPVPLELTLPKKAKAK